jgi:hypothetical protein
MGLEVATYINGLVITNPVGASDPKSQGDDHLRLLKSTIKNTFPNLTGAMTADQTELNLLDGITGFTGTGATLVKSAGPTITGTLAGASQTLSGTLDVTGTLTASGKLIVGDAIKVQGAYDTPLTGVHTFLDVVSATTARLGGITTGGSPAPLISWSSTFEIWTDASTPAVRAMFSGAEIDLTATLLDFNGAVDISGALVVGGAATLATNSLIEGAGGNTASLYLQHNANASSGFLFQQDSSNHAYIWNYENANLVLATNNATVLTFAPGGAITTANTDAGEVGFKGTPQNAQAGNYTLVLTDAGKVIYKASGGAGETITIPANGSVAFPVGTIIRIVNNGGGSLTIAITTDTLSLAGAGTTGSRTLSDHGVAIIEKVATTEWFISGSGVS